MSTPLSVLSAYLGIDIAKQKLDVVLRAVEKSSHRIFSNSPQGFAALDDWIRQQGPLQLHVCLEATGSYSDGIARFLSDQGHTVSVLNPAILVTYRQSKNTRRKNDQVDASLLAQYAQDEQPAAWIPLPAEVIRLRYLLAYRDDLVRMRVQERNRQEAGHLDTELLPIIQDHLQWFTHRQQEIEKSIKALLKDSTELSGPWGHLQTMPGIGWYAAATLIAHVGDIRGFPKVGALVCLAGLSLNDCVSGSSVFRRPSLDRHGRAALRSLLYMCAMAALPADPHMRTWADQLRSRGKPNKVVLVAVMRKLLPIAYGVWKNESDYDPTRAFAACA